MIEKVRSLVMAETPPEDYAHHVKLVVKYALILAQKLNSSTELAELGALLHDIGRIRHPGKGEHSITGKKEAEEILEQAGYGDETIREIVHCVESHRGSAAIKPRTTTASIVANADAMAHFDTIPHFIRIGLQKFDHDIVNAVKWVADKIERDWSEKLTIPYARKLTKEKYEAAKLVLSFMADLG